MATSVVLARYLGPHGYGDYTYILTYIGFFGALVWMGLDPIIIREIASRADAEDRSLSLILSLKLVMSLAAVFLALVIFPALKTERNLWPTMAMASIALPVGAMAAPGLIFNARLRMEYRVLAETATAITSFLLVLLVVRISGNIHGAVGANLAATIFGVCILLLLTTKFVKIRIVISLEEWKSLLIEAVPYGLAGFLQLLYSRISILMLSSIQGSAATGLYVVGYNFFDQFAVFFAFFATSLFPLLAQLVNERSRLRLWINRGLVIAGLSSLAFIICVFLGGNILINWLYGAGFEASSSSLKILACATPFTSSTLILSWALVALHQQKKLFRVCTIAFAVNILLNLILIPRFSYAGSAIATLVTEAVVLFQIGIILKNILKTKDLST